MPGLVPGIHVLPRTPCVDGRVKPGHDELVVATDHHHSAFVSERHAPAFSRRVCVRVIDFDFPPTCRGRREDRAPAGARGPRATRKHAAEPQAQPRTPGLPCAMALTAASRSPRGSAFLPPSSACSSQRRFSARTAAPGPHDLTVRTGSFVRVLKSRCDPLRPPLSAPRIVTTARTPLASGQDGAQASMISEKKK